MIHSRPQITENIIADINKYIEDNPNWGRKRLSIELCELWGWKGENGVAKDISCRDMLRSLDAAGKIILPKPKKCSRYEGQVMKIVQYAHDTTPVEATLQEMMPLQVKVVTTKEETAVMKSYIQQYHYLGYCRDVGETMKYAVYSREGIPLANLIFGASAWTCQPRDEYIGWNNEQRKAFLRFTTDNQRYLIYPWIHVPHLASHILGLICRRISGDWIKKYGHCLYVIETFVDHRFTGASYRAANWRRIGCTKGRGRNDRKNEWAVTKKDIYLYPLSRHWRESILAGSSIR